MCSSAPGGGDTLRGNAGDDTLSGGAGVDDIHGGNGNDLLLVGGSDDVSDTLLGGGGTDTIRSLAGDIEVDRFANTGIEVIDSATGVLRGTADANLLNLGSSSWFGVSGTVAAGGGNDSVTGTSGNDMLSGEDGADLISGGSGTDLLVGGEGADTLRGNQGDDKLVAGGGDDAHGGNNDDLLRFDGTLAGDLAILHGGAGTNTLELALTATQLADQAVQDDLTALQAWIDAGSPGSLDLTGLNIRVTSFDGYILS